MLGAGEGGGLVLGAHVLRSQHESAAAHDGLEHILLLRAWASGGGHARGGSDDRPRLCLHECEHWAWVLP